MAARNLVILGSGPAGLTAAIYAARANLNPLVLAGTKWGGQLMLTTGVENFPGFPDGVLGPELMEFMKRQAERFGAEMVYEDAVSVELRRRPFRISTGEAEHAAEALIIATGASSRWLGLPSEAPLIGRGVSSCATCDGAFFKGKEVIVVGGGDSAAEDALFLTRFAGRVTLVHRRDRLRASKIMQERLKRNPKVSFAWDTVVEEVLGREKVEGVKFKNVKSGAATTKRCDGLFVAIGHEPDTAIFKGQLELDERGYVRVRDETRTSMEGVFVAGDVHDHRYRQAVTAAGSGCKAAMDAERWLEARE